MNMVMEGRVLERRGKTNGSIRADACMLGANVIRRLGFGFDSLYCFGVCGTEGAARKAH
jgi:hypothetical protein